MLFEDRTEAIAEVLAANGEIMHEQHPTLQ